MSETTSSEAPEGADGHTQRQIPITKIWIIGGLFFIAAVGMYAGTMYRIQHYGYVGVGADQPIESGAELKN